ncbi:MAG: hypothetical protein M3Y45_06005, partial [Actinomycetota bacterium]|nr:hypothetical protein [Actinomycetota bacterium]
MGVTFAALAEAITGKKLLFGKFAEAPVGWEDSLSSAVSGLLVPTILTSTFAVSLVVWVLMAVFLGAIISRARARRAGSPGPAEAGALTFTPVGSNRVPNAH